MYIIFVFDVFSEQKVRQYEQYVHDLQAHNCALVNNQDTSSGTCYPELQQEVRTFI